MRFKDKQPTKIFAQQSKYYRKRPVIVRAMRIHFAFEVETTEGIIKGKPGDWLVEGIEKELYPCKHSVFKDTYEEVK